MDTSGDVAASLNYPKEHRKNLDFSEMENMSSAREAALLNYKKQPSSVKSRVNALKNLQYQTFKLESEFYKELNLMEVKYENAYFEINNKRRNIYLGTVHPTEEECTLQFKVTADEMESVSSDIKAKLTVIEDDANVSMETNLAEGDQGVDIKGIPDFWYTIFKNVPLLNERIEEYDWPIIKSLVDVSSVMINDISPGFKIVFTFAPNDYFTNTVLSRIFYVNFDLPTDNPLSFEGPEIVMSKGCKIDWKPNKNVTIKNIKQMKKSRAKGEKRSITKTCKTNSFFNFFENIISKNDGKFSDDPETMNQIDSDFEIGQYLRERIIPRAVLFYTGEGIEEEEDDDEEESSIESESPSACSSSDEDIVSNTRSRPLLRK